MGEPSWGNKTCGSEISCHNLADLVRQVLLTSYCRSIAFGRLKSSGSNADDWFVRSARCHDARLISPSSPAQDSVINIIINHKGTGKLRYWQPASAGVTGLAPGLARRPYERTGYF